MAHISAIYKSMQNLVGKTTFFGKPFAHDIGVAGMCTTYGIFNTALQLRGIDLFMDILDDPDYVTGLLRRVAEGYVCRRHAWAPRHKGELPPPSIVYDHGIDMISIEQYKRILVPVYYELKAMLGADAFDRNIEHCGHGEAVIRYKHQHFGVRQFHNLNAAFLDVERLRHDLGPEVWLGVTISPEIVHSGPPERLHAAVKQLLSPALKGKGRLYIHMAAWDYPEAPFDHILAFYDAVKEYGRY